MKDYLIGAIVGIFTGILAIFIFGFLNIKIPYQIFALLIAPPIIFSFGIWFGKFLGRWMPFFDQLGKFAVVGFLSTAIDFSILNIVSSATGITAGTTVGWVNVPGFLAATINGYLWNKLWVFRAKSRNFGDEISGLVAKYNSDDRDENEEISDTKFRLFNDFPKFISVTAIGLLINSSLIILLTTYFKIPFGLSAVGWLNVAKVLATLVAMIWNFLGYKFFAFKIKNK